MPVAATIFEAHSFIVARWVSETGTSLAANVQQYGSITVQAVGTGTVTVEGSMDGTNWEPLNAVGSDPAAPTAISLDATSNEIGVLLEHPSLIRVVVAAGTATVTALGSSGR